MQFRGTGIRVACNSRASRSVAERGEADVNPTQGCRLCRPPLRSSGATPPYALYMKDACSNKSSNKTATTVA